MFIVEATNKLNVKRVRKIEKVINGSLSGIIAGIVMGIAVSIANVLNVTAYHSIEIAGGIFIQEVLESPGILWIIVGWLSHLVIAMALGITLCYIYYFTGAGYALLKGLLFGGFTWLLNLGIIAPLINYNIMERLDSLDLLFSFGLHLLFGIITAWLLIKFGPIYREEAEDQSDEERAAYIQKISGII